jgi:hypothetical protein
MHDPRLDPNVRHGRKIRLHQITQIPPALDIVELLVGEPPIVMRVEDGFVEVLFFWVASFAAPVFREAGADGVEVSVALPERGSIYSCYAFEQ